MLEPLSDDLAAARRLGHQAIDAHAGPGAWSESWRRSFDERLVAGRVAGRLYVVDGVPSGFVSWTDGGPPGVSVDLWFALGTAAVPETYADLLYGVQEASGPVAFAPGALAGVAPEAEDRLMRGLGFAPYGRSEMSLRAGATLPAVLPEPGELLRPVETNDLPKLAELHRRAYHGRFDRYLFYELPDEAADAAREVREMFEGRWGPFVPAGSWIAERAGEVVGAVLAVHGGAGVLLADVMVDPALQGRGIGRRVLLTALRALRASGEGSIYLNVTEGNAPALRLYERVGFARSLGPSRDWYSTLRIPVAPDAPP